MKKVPLFVLGVLLILPFVRAAGQRSSTDWYLLGGGFGVSCSRNAATTSVFCQSFDGESNEANSRVTSGFLADSLLGGRITSVPEREAVPGNFALGQNYPNPFNPITTIRFDVPERVNVTLQVFNLLGQRVATLINEERPPGTYLAHFDAVAFSSGTYFYVLRAGTFLQVRKLMVLK